MIREVAVDGRTVFLSSHALGEVQRVADRVGIIRGGHLVALETVADLRAKALRRIEFTFETVPDPAMFRGVPGVRRIDADNHHLVVSFDGKMKALLEAVGDGNSLVDISTEDADLDEIFLTYYRGDDAADASAATGAGNPSDDRGSEKVAR